MIQFSEYFCLPNSSIEIVNCVPHNEAMRLVALLALWVAVACQAITIDGHVVGVADGDTITVLDGANRQHKIRLAGIDAPEKSQPFGHCSKESLSDLVFSKTVTVEIEKVDRYGRQVGKVLVDGADANLAQVQWGLRGITKPMSESSLQGIARHIPMQRLRQRPRDWVYGQMRIRCHPGSFAIRRSDSLVSSLAMIGIGRLPRKTTAKLPQFLSIS